jgi:hypothetical protein
MQSLKFWTIPPTVTTLVCVGGVDIFGAADIDVGGVDIDLSSLSAPLFCTHGLGSNGLGIFGLVTLGIDDG